MPEITQVDGLHVDWHCHSRWSDGRGTLPELLAAAAQRGVALGNSDHAFGDNRRLQTAAQFEDYLEDLTQYPILRGIEISVGDPLDRTDLDPYVDQLDYVIASLHTLTVPEGVVSAVRYQNYRAGLYPGYAPSVKRHDRHTFFETWLRGLEATAERWPVRILGHFCLLPEQANRQGHYVLDEDTEPDDDAWAYLDATIDLCLRYDVAVELNSKSRLPHEAFVKRALERGVRFSLGSDAHHVHRAGDVSYGRQLAERLAIPAERFLRPAGLARPVRAGTCASTATAEAAAG